MFTLIREIFLRTRTGMVLIALVRYGALPGRTWSRISLLPAVLAGLSNDGPQNADKARQIVTAFAEKAFRRLLREHEAAPFGSLIEKETAAGRSIASATRSVLMAVLCSKDFIFLVEHDAGPIRTDINEWELASRLSCSLWSTMPDDPLLAAARSTAFQIVSLSAGQISHCVSELGLQVFLINLETPVPRLNKG